MFVLPHVEKGNCQQLDDQKMISSLSSITYSFSQSIEIYRASLLLVLRWTNQTNIRLTLVFSTSGALKYQTNLEGHPPGCLRANQSSTESQGKEPGQGEAEERRRCIEEAHFQPHYPQVCVCVWVYFSYMLAFKCTVCVCVCAVQPVLLCVCVCVEMEKCQWEFIRGAVLLGRSRHPPSTSRRVFVCVSSCLCDYAFAHGR